MTTFCDNDEANLQTLHNDEAPSAHNDLCDGRSAWEVMREHDDFKNGASRKYTGTSVIRSPMGPGKTDLNFKVTVLQSVTCYRLQCGIQFGT